MMFNWRDPRKMSADELLLDYLANRRTCEHYDTHECYRCGLERVRKEMKTRKTHPLNEAGVCENCCGLCKGERLV